jgi:hypothetical protein
MRNYIIRVQLQLAEPADWQYLEKELQKESLKSVTKNPEIEKGTARRSGEFNYQGRTSLQDITAAVYRAAKKTGKEYSFTVMKDKNNSAAQAVAVPV